MLFKILTSLKHYLSFTGKATQITLNIMKILSQSSIKKKKKKVSQFRRLDKGQKSLVQK